MAAPKVFKPDIALIQLGKLLIDEFTAKTDPVLFRGNIEIPFGQEAADTYLCLDNSSLLYPHAGYIRDPIASKYEQREIRQKHLEKAICPSGAYFLGIITDPADLFQNPLGFAYAVYKLTGYKTHRIYQFLKDESDCVSERVRIPGTGGSMVCGG